MNVFFDFYLFFSKDKSSHQRCSVKKVFLNVLAIYRKAPGLESIFKRLQVFKNTYFEEQLLTTASKNTNICLTIKVLPLLRIKLLNSNVNKKKACAKT